MIKDKKLLQEFEKDLIKKGKSNYFNNLNIMDEMLKEAIYLKVFPPRNPLEGIEVDIKIARIINNVQRTY